MKTATFPRILFALATLLPDPARAECPILQEVLEERSEDLQVFSTRNAQMMASVLQTEKDCHVQGAKISARIAKAAESLTCQAQSDATEINREMEQIGITCTTAFQKRHELQTMLHTDFNKLLADVDDGVNYIVKSDILNEECSDEVGTAKKLYKATHVTEGNIVATELRALGAMNSYEKFRETSEVLKRQTEARNTACGHQPGFPALPPLPTGVPGQGAPHMVAGVTPKDASDITGRSDNLKLANAETTKIDRTRFPKGTASQENQSSQITSGGYASQAQARAPKAESPTASALETYTKRALLPQKTAMAGPEPVSALGSAVMAAWTATEVEAKTKQATGTESPKEKPEARSISANERAAAGTPSRSPASSEAPAAQPAPQGVQFLGELSPEGEAVSDAEPMAESTLFQRVQNKYRRKELALNPRIPLKAEASLSQLTR